MNDEPTIIIYKELNREDSGPHILDIFKIVFVTIKFQDTITQIPRYNLYKILL